MKSALGFVVLSVTSVLTFSHKAMSEEPDAQNVRALIEDLGNDRARVRNQARLELIKLPVRSLNLLSTGDTHPSPHVRYETASIRDYILERKVVLPLKVSGAFHGTIHDILKELFKHSGTVLPEIYSDSVETRSFTFKKKEFWRAVAEVLDEFSFTPYFSKKEGLSFRPSEKKYHRSFHGPVVIYEIDPSYYDDFTMVMLVEGDIPFPRMYHTERINQLQDKKSCKISIYKEKISLQGDNIGYYMEIREQITLPMMIEFESDIRVRKRMDFTFPKASVDPFRFVAKFL